jgi:MOSC domain-containing protein YiiM
LVTLLSVQIGAVRRVKIGERTVLTAINKQPLHGLVPVMPLGLMGDEQADLSIHGGLEKAIYAYPSEHYAFWRKARHDAGVSGVDESLPHGILGDNLTLAGLLETDVWAGDVLQFPNCALAVTIPREPCHKFNVAMGFSQATKLMATHGFCGFYLSVREAGTISAGEKFELIPGRRSVSITQLFNAKMVKHLR